MPPGGSGRSTGGGSTGTPFRPAVVPVVLRDHHPVQVGRARGPVEPRTAGEVASREFGLPERLVWMIIREQGVPVVWGPRARMRTTKFRREDWRAGRDQLESFFAELDAKWVVIEVRQREGEMPVIVVAPRELHQNAEARAAQQALIRYNYAGQWVAWRPDFSGIEAHAERFEDFLAAAEATGLGDLVFERVPPVPVRPASVGGEQVGRGDE